MKLSLLYFHILAYYIYECHEHLVCFAKLALRSNKWITCGLDNVSEMYFSLCFRRHRYWTDDFRLSHLSQANVWSSVFTWFSYGWPASSCQPAAPPLQPDHTHRREHKCKSRSARRTCFLLVLWYFYTAAFVDQNDGLQVEGVLPCSPLFPLQKTKVELLLFAASMMTWSRWGHPLVLTDRLVLRQVKIKLIKCKMCLFVQSAATSS